MVCLSQRYLATLMKGGQPRDQVDFLRALLQRNPQTPPVGHFFVSIYGYQSSFARISESTTMFELLFSG